MKVPLKSYDKTTLAKLYANDNLIIRQFWVKVNNDPELLKKLSEAGYNKYKKILEIKTVQVLFEYFGTPTLNAKNKALLGIKKQPTIQTLNTMIKDKGDLIAIQDIDNETLLSIGIIKDENPDLNIYRIENNEKRCLVKQADGTFKLFYFPEFEEIMEIKDTLTLIRVLFGLGRDKV